MTGTSLRSALCRRLRRVSTASEDGFTITEMLTVLVVLVIILAPLTGSFVSALGAQIDQENRFDAQESARVALDRMRKDIHCAHGVTDPYVNDSGGNTIVMTETNVTGTAECPGLVQTNASAVQWCTVPVEGATDRYRLYRENDPDNLCDGVGSTFMVDYLTQPDLWESPTCVSTQYPTVGVTLPVDVEPVHNPAGSYQLTDRIALRNGDICP